jgi:hypothetical protein
MTIAMQPIYTQTVTGSTVGVVTFNSIPQTFTDLQVVISARTNRSNFGADNITMQCNGDASSLYSSTFLYGNGGSVAAGRTSAQGSFRDFILVNGGTATTNAFGTAQVYVPNYVGANFKSFVAEGVSEDNITTGLQWPAAGLYRSTNAITSLSFAPQNTNYFIAGSTFSIYGITKG